MNLSNIYRTPDDEKTVICKIGDNGMGIQDDILQKIWQPFFTTKPSGKGTGLGWQSVDKSYNRTKVPGIHW